MKYLPKTKLILRVCLWGWFIFWTFAGLLQVINFPTQLKRARKWEEKELINPSKWVSNFKVKNSRFPTSREFNEWQLKNCGILKDNNEKWIDSLEESHKYEWCIKYFLETDTADLTKEIKSQITNFKRGNDFFISTWDGDQDRYLFSNGLRLIPRGLRWIDMIIMIVFVEFVALIPIGILEFIYWRKKKSIT